MSLIGDMLCGMDDRVWQALGDRTRREMIAWMARGATGTGDLVERFAPQLGRTGVMKHLDVLESAGLLRVERVGRRRLNHLEAAPLEKACGWLEDRVQGHQRRLVRLKSLAESEPARNRKKP